MIPDPRTLRDEALDWLAKTGDPGFEDWDGFTAWLERSPSHAEAYHQVAERMADMDEYLTQLPDTPAPDMSPPIRRASPVRWSIAASLAALAATGAVFLSPAFTSDRYSTAAGETRTIALGDGDELILNGDTQVAVSGFGRRDVEIENGQMLLKLASDRHVEVTSGDLRMVDIGTIFEVARSRNQTRLLVEQGSVMADPKGARVTVKAGQMLEARDGDRELLANSAPDTQAGGWTSGQLSYFDASIAQVVADLHRSTGLAISPSPAMSRRRFSGTLSIDHIRKDPASLGPLLGARAGKSGGTWILEEGS